MAKRVTYLLQLSPHASGHLQHVGLLQVVRQQAPDHEGDRHKKVLWLHNRHQPSHSTRAQLPVVTETKPTQLPSTALLGGATSLLMNGVTSEGTDRMGTSLWDHESALLNSYGQRPFISKLPSTLPPLTPSFGNALQFACGTAGLTRAGSRFKNTVLKADPAASVQSSVQTRSAGELLGRRHTQAQPCPGSYQRANKPVICSGRWSDAQRAPCA